MNDRELLELAAKAAGIKLEPDGWSEQGKSYYAEQMNNISGVWNPLNDDGDALRLAVQLQLLGLNRNRFSESFANDYAEGAQPDCPYAATRRALVRAAAEIGKAMPTAPAERS